MTTATMMNGHGQIADSDFGKHYNKIQLEKSGKHLCPYAWVEGNVQGLRYSGGPSCNCIAPRRVRAIAHQPGVFGIIVVHKFFNSHRESLLPRKKPA